MALPLLIPLAALQGVYIVGSVEVVTDGDPAWLKAVYVIAPIVNTIFLYLMHKRGKRVERSVNATKSAARESADELAHLAPPETRDK